MPAAARIHARGKVVDKVPTTSCSEPLATGHLFCNVQVTTSVRSFISAALDPHCSSKSRSVYYHYLPHEFQIDGAVMGRNTYRSVLGEPMATASSGRSLLVLPPELWHKILRSLSREDQRTCFQLSRFFHDIAQHLLFRHVTIYFGVDFDICPADRLTAQQMTARSEQAERTREILRHTYWAKHSVRADRPHNHCARPRALPAEP